MQCIMDWIGCGCGWLRSTPNATTPLHRIPFSMINFFITFRIEALGPVLVCCDSGVLWHSRYMRHLTFISFPFIHVRCEWVSLTHSHSTNRSKDDLVSLDFFSLRFFFLLCTAAASLLYAGHSFLVCSLNGSNDSWNGVNHSKLPQHTKNIYKTRKKKQRMK